MADDTAVATPDADARPEQTVTVEDAGPALKRLTIEVPEGRIKGKIEEQFDNLKRDAQVPGFRKGRAPHRLIERRFGEALRGDVKGQLLSESYTQAIEDQKLEVIGEPDVKDIESIELPESGPMTYTVEVEVTPQIELPAFDSLSVDKVKTEVTDDDVAQEIDNARQRMGQPKNVTDEPAAEGDYLEGPAKVLAGKDAADDAEVLHELPTAYVVVNGESADYKGHIAGIVIDDLGKTLAGKKHGETLRISTTGPKQHEIESLREKPITIVFTITGVQRIEPAPAEALIQQLGVENEDQLKGRLREMLEQRAQQQQQAGLYDQVRGKLVEAVDIELPAGLTGRQVERTLQRRRMELMYRGTSPDEVEQQLAELRDSSEEEAVRQLQEFFILDKAAKDLEVEVGENEINAQVAQMAFQQGRRPEKMRAELRERGDLENLFLQIREQKTLDQILEKVTVNEVDAPAKPKAATKTAKKKTTKKKTTKKTTKKKAAAKKAD